jgi:hypothetical protein
MRREIPTRLIAVAIAVGSLLALPLSGSSPAVVASSSSCKKLVSPPPVLINKVLTSKSTVSACTPLAKTGGSGKSVTKIGIKVGGKTVTVSTTTWAGGKGTTIATLTYKTSPKLGNCPTGTTLRVTATGIVTGGTNKLIKKGETETATVCVSKADSATLAPGTTWKF